MQFQVSALWRLTPFWLTYSTDTSYLCAVQQSIYNVDVVVGPYHYSVRRDSGQVTVSVLWDLGFSAMGTQQLEICRSKIHCPRFPRVTWTNTQSGVFTSLKMMRPLKREHFVSWYFLPSVFWKTVECLMKATSPSPFARHLNGQIDRQTHVVCGISSRYFSVGGKRVGEADLVVSRK